jgi:glycosyltransferase involved in cell wall biosynthesis
MNEQKHILIVNSWFPTLKDPTHGIFNHYFAKAISLYNKVTVLNISSFDNCNPLFDVSKSMENEVYTVSVKYKKNRSSSKLYTLILKRKMFFKAFNAGFNFILDKVGKPDIIHLNVTMPMGYGVQYLSKKYNIPFVVNENWSGYCKEDGNYKGLFKKLVTKYILNQASAIMPTSTYLRDAMLSHGLKGNYHVVPNTVNVNVFKPITADAHHGTKLIHISSLNDREKNVSGIIRAFSKALNSNPDLHLNLVGEGVDKVAYEKLVTELNLHNNVSFLGRLFSTDLVREINAADALVMFSHFETFCLVIIEAFACGKPVITSSAGAIKTYMKPELGIMMEPNNESQLTEAILNFTKNKSTFDCNYIRTYAVENYSYEKVGKDLDLIYQKVLAAHAKN